MPVPPDYPDRERCRLAWLPEIALEADRLAVHGEVAAPVRDGIGRR